MRNLLLFLHFRYIINMLLYVSGFVTEDILTDAKGECVICLEDMEKGNVIAR